MVTNHALDVDERPHVGARRKGTREVVFYHHNLIIIDNLSAKDRGLNNSFDLSFLRLSGLIPQLLQLDILLNPRS